MQGNTRQGGLLFLHVLIIFVSMGRDRVSCGTAESDAPTVHPPHDTWVNIEQQWNDADKGRRNCSGDLPQCHFVHRKSHTDCLSYGTASFKPHMHQRTCSIQNDSMHKFKTGLKYVLFRKNRLHEGKFRTLIPSLRCYEVCGGKYTWIAALNIYILSPYRCLARDESTNEGKHCYKVSAGQAYRTQAVIYEYGEHER